jgi:site-specific DNA-methyltransferase (adenine-specific)
MAELKTNVLYYGDNLEILRNHIPSESVDLVYLDPPFNSKADYNVLFREESGERSAAQIKAFSDSWHWDSTAEETYNEIIRMCPDKVATMVSALRQGIGSNDVMAYLVMMTVRLVELRRVLKPTGSLYLHCDPTASHYLKVVLDGILGTGNFRNEVIWKRTHAHGGSQKYGPVHDVILFYSKTAEFKWTSARVEQDSEYVAKAFSQTEAETGRRFQAISLTGSGVRYGESGEPWRGVNPTSVGRHWALPGSILRDLGVRTGTVQERLDALDAASLIYWPDKSEGVPRLKWYADALGGKAVLDTWTDIPPASGRERLGYATQKPQALLERIIQASSNEGDVVLDPFCGCGTAVVAAQTLNRHWIGIDVTHLAITVMKERLRDAFPGIEFEVMGEPKDVASARQLAADDRYQFQWWALSLVNARPAGDDRKKGADTGIDGVIGFVEEKGKAARVIVSVKSGHVNVGQVRDLKGVVDREKAAMGLFITLEPSTEPMRVEAVSAGFYHSNVWDKDYPKIQILTVEELLAGKQPLLPPFSAGGFAKAQKIGKQEGRQRELI